MTHAYPNSHVFYRKLTRDHPLIVRGEGCYLFDDTGKRYFDGSGGAFVANIGHGVKEIGAAMAEQASKVAYLNGTAFTHQPVEELSNELAKSLPPGLEFCYFLSSGSEAVEAGDRKSTRLNSSHYNTSYAVFCLDRKSVV